MRKRVPFSTVLLFIAIQSTLLIDVMHTPTSHRSAVNPYTIPNPQGAARIFPLRDDDQTARQLLAERHFQEAQDEYVSIGGGLSLGGVGGVSGSGGAGGAGGSNKDGGTGQH